MKETGPAWNEDLRAENGGIRGVNRVRDMLIVLAVTFFSDLVLGVSRQPWVFACFAARLTAVGCTVMEINARQSASARVAHHRSVVYHGFWTPGVCARFHAPLRLWSGHKPQINLLCLLPLGQAALPQDGATGLQQLQRSIRLIVVDMEKLFLLSRNGLSLALAV